MEQSKEKRILKPWQAIAIMVFGLLSFLFFLGNLLPFEANESSGDIAYRLVKCGVGIWIFVYGAKAWIASRKLSHEVEA